MYRKLVPALLVPLLLAPACAREANGDALRVDTISPAAALLAAPDRAVDAGTVRFEISFSVTGAADSDIALTGTGASDYDHGTAQLSMDLGALGGGLGENAPAGFDEPIELIVDGDTTYVRIPFLEHLTGTSGWLSATPEDLGQQAGALGFGGGASDPSRLLETLRGVADDVEEDGHEDVRGVPTTRYTATIDLAQALAEAPEARRGPLRAQLDQLGGADVPKIPVTVWIDEEGLTRRLVLSLDGLGGDAAADMGGEVTVELFDYGKPVRIDVPSPDEVTPFTDVLGPLAGSFTDEPS